MSIRDNNSLPISNSNNGYLIVQTALKILNLSLNWRFLIFCFVELWFPKYHYFEYHGYVKVIKKCRTPFLFVLYPQYLETLTISKFSLSSSGLWEQGLTVVPTFWLADEESRNSIKFAGKLLYYRFTHKICRFLFILISFKCELILIGKCILLN